MNDHDIAHHAEQISAVLNVLVAVCIIAFVSLVLVFPNS
jgi:hypothetical protein